MISVSSSSRERVSTGAKPNSSNFARKAPTTRCSTIRCSGNHSGNPLMGLTFAMPRRGYPKGAMWRRVSATTCGAPAEASPDTSCAPPRSSSGSRATPPPSGARDPRAPVCAFLPCARRGWPFAGVLGLRDVERLRALVATTDLEGHASALLQRAKAVAVGVRVVDEQVLAPVLGSDEAEALVVVEPLDGSRCHVSSTAKVRRSRRVHQSNNGGRLHKYRRACARPNKATVASRVVAMTRPCHASRPDAPPSRHLPGPLREGLARRAGRARADRDDRRGRADDGIRS